MSDNRWKPGDKPRSGDKYTFLEGMRRLGKGALGQEIINAVEQAVWTSMPSDDPFKMRVWQGVTGRFHFTVMDFELESQGFRGYRGAEGVVRVGTEVIRLSNELAGRAVELAVAQGVTA